MDFEYFYRNNTGRRYNTPEEKAEALRAWELGAELAEKRKDVSSEKIRKLAEKVADKAKPVNSILWVRAFCRGYAETKAARQEEQKDMTKEIKKLWKANRLMDAVAIARELNLAPSQVMQSIYTFTTAEERWEREYAIAKDYHDSTGSWPEGFEEEADEASQTDKEEEPEQKPEQAAETEKTTEEEHGADMPEQGEAKAEEVSPQRKPRPEQIIAACVMQIATQVEILRQEHEKFVNDTRQEFVKLTTEMSAAIKEAEENARIKERKRILSMIGEMK